MTGMFSFGNVTGLIALVFFAAGIFWVMVQRNKPVVSVASMLRSGKDR